MSSSVCNTTGRSDIKFETSVIDNCMDWRARREGLRHLSVAIYLDLCDLLKQLEFFQSIYDLTVKLQVFSDIAVDFSGVICQNTHSYIHFYRRLSVFRSFL